MSTTLMSCEKITVERRGRVILDVPSFHVEDGERLAVLGPTGAGKSTLLGVLGMIILPDRGSLLWRGEPMDKAKPGSTVRRKIAMAFQVPLLFKGTVYDNVAYGLTLRKVDKQTIYQKVSEILGLFKISDLAHANAQSLSGGEAHRVALARALIFGPELLMLDEPMASLDPATKDTLLRELMTILKKLRVTCVYVTHSREEAFIVADRLVVLEDGKIAQTGSKEDIFYRPETVKVAAFIGTGNILKGTIQSVTREGLALIETERIVIEAISDAGAGKHVDVCIRPEEIFLEDASGKKSGSSSARNRIAGVVSGIEELGAVAEVTVDCGATLKTLVTRRSFDDLHIKVGMEVIAGFKATSVHVIERGEDDRP